MLDYNNMKESNYYLNSLQGKVIQAKEAKKLLLEETLEYVNEVIKKQIKKQKLDFGMHFDESIIEDVKTYLITIGYNVRRKRWFGNRTTLFISVR